jgi:3',5'-cyclic AMP phosphodiesterase CpdA
MLIAQLSDMHMRPRGKAAIRVVETNMLAARAVDAVKALDPRPVAALVTGDLVNNGTPEEYETAREVLGALPMPVYVIPGNHDNRANFRAALKDFPGVVAHPRFVQYAIEEHAVRLVALDTHIPGETAGELCEERLDWLEATLAAGRDRPTLVLLHHPPFICGIGHMDQIRLIAGAERLEEIVRANPQVRALTCGHHHRPIETVFGGTLASIAPGTAHQVEFDLREGAPGGRLNLEPPALRVWRWDGERLVSHMAYVERFPGPFPFIPD